LDFHSAPFVLASLVLVLVLETRKPEDDHEDEDDHEAVACAHFLNPERIPAFSPRLARVREGLPGVIVKNDHNPERVASAGISKPATTLSGL
jgi:hypothetical protein